jgi:alpha/beta hydrolase family protein
MTDPNSRRCRPRLGRAGCSSVAVVLLVAITAPRVFADVVRFEIRSSREVSGGRSFGSAGPYEEVTGRLYFAANPQEAVNRLVVDLDKAATDAGGRVEFSADVVIYRPRDPARGNGIALIDVVNRGNKTIISGFNRPGMMMDREAGDGFVFARGYTVVCVGWEFDVTKRDGAIRIDAPIAAGVRGIVRAIFAPAAAGREFTVSDVAGYVPTDPSARENTLTVRDAPLSTPAALPRTGWHLNGNTVTLESGFEPGRWYELTYTATDPPIGGVGFLAVRDTARWLKQGTDVARARHVIAFGSSQSGRFLRNFLYEGFNTDEHGEQALDGVMAHIAGSARLDLNRRWSTPTSLGTYTATSFPFADVKTRDPMTGADEGALDNARARKNQPKIFYTNTGVEYWGGGRVAALVHTSPDGTRDLDLWNLLAGQSTSTKAQRDVR